MNIGWRTKYILALSEDFLIHRCKLSGTMGLAHGFHLSNKAASKPESIILVLMPPYLFIYLCMGLDFTLRNNPLKQLWRAFTLLIHSTCPILPHYRTTRKTISLHLSDSSALSDNQKDNLTPLVRFFHIIGQPERQSHSTCPIPPSYQTTSKTNSLHLSDFSALSDNHHRSSVLQRNLFHEFGHVLEGVAAILQ